MSQLSSSPQDRLQRARVALEGLSVADALGGFFEFNNPIVVANYVRLKKTPNVEWHYTDDTNMALSIYEILRKHGQIEQDALAQSFAHHYDRLRGYGKGARHVLSRVKNGEAWRTVATSMFNGGGSFGNGGAMRVAPLGAYFADDFDALVNNARKSAEITHAHEEGIAGAIAVAVATAYAYRLRGESPTRKQLIALILPHIPESTVKKGCIKAYEFAEDTPLVTAVEQLGNGSAVSAMDTVPFVLWSAGEHLDNYETSFWQTASAGGDADTTCAMVGGIIASYHGTNIIPSQWIAQRESLPDWALTD